MPTDHYIKNREKYLERAKKRYSLKKEEIKKYSKEYYQKNKEKAKTWKSRTDKEYIKKCSKKQYEKNKAKIRKRNQEYYYSHKEEAKIYHREYRQKNLGRTNSYKKKYKLRKKRCCPKWLNKEQHNKMKEFYQNCPKGYHVDHIVPIQGVNVSGLHVPWNLQYLPAVENIKKRNKY